MMRRLFFNTLLSGGAFAVVGVLHFLVIPIIVGRWGIAALGLVMLARSFLPQGFLAIFDLGASELSTQAVARARVNGDWALARRHIRFLLAAATAIGILAGAALWLLAPALTTLLNVDAAEFADFERLLQVTGLATLVLMPSLVGEGVVKGFERFGLLRAMEVGTLLAYAGAVILLATTDLSFVFVAYAYLAALVVRFATLGIAAPLLLRARAPVPDLSVPVGWRGPLVAHMGVMVQAKILGALQNQAPPLLAGILFGPAAAGIYEILTRLPRFAKQAVAILNVALLPVSARVREANSRADRQRLARMGFVIAPAITVPALALAAIASEPVLRLWIGPEYAPQWAWMALMFAVPIAAQYLGFMGVMALVDKDLQRAFNRLSAIQVFLSVTLALALAIPLGAQGLILAQAISVLTILPFQTAQAWRQMELDPRQMLRPMALQAAISVVVLAAAFLSLQLLAIGNLVLLAAWLALWYAVYFALEMAVMLTRDDRAEVFRMIGALLPGPLRRLVGL